MKISKKCTSACNHVQPDKSKNDYATVQSYIRSAITELGNMPNSDDVTKDAISNLAVVLFDLDSSE